MILSVCDVPDVLKVMKIVNLVINIIRIVVPIMLIVTGMIDYMKATTDGEGVSKPNKLLVSKIVAAVIVVAVPTLVNIVFNVIDPKEVTYISCLDNATTERINELYQENMEKRLREARNSKTNQAYQDAKNYLTNIKDPALKEQYKKELEEIKTQINKNDVPTGNPTTIVYQGLSPEEVNSKINSMATPTMEEINQAFRDNNVSDEYAKIVTGTTYNEGYGNEPYLLYGWANAMLNNNFSLSQLQGWDPGVGDANWYSWKNINKGCENIKSADVYKKALYLALTYRDKSISNCYGGPESMDHCKIYTSKYQNPVINVYACF